MDPLNKFYTSKEAGYFDSVRKEIQPLLPESIDKVLEVGCGSGSTLEWLKSEMGSNWVGGVELNEDAADKAKDRLDFFMVGNIESLELPLEESSLDLILCLDVLEHLVDPWMLAKRLSRFLKPGGSMIVSLPNIFHRSAMLPLIIDDRWDYMPSGILDRTHLRFFTRKTATELLEQGNLKVVHVIPVMPMKRGSKTWLFHMLTLNLFNRLFTTQYLIKGVKTSTDLAPKKRIS